MTADEAVVAVIDALEAASAPYMIVGSLASNLHGIPRSTRDADVVVELAPEHLQQIERALPAELRLAAQGSFEPVTGTTRYIVELTNSAFVCELFVRGEDPHDVERFRRRQRVRTLGRDAYVATAEDMIVTKLRWAIEAHRDKDRADIRNMLAVRGTELDWAYIGRWADVHGTSALLDEIRRSISA